MASFVGAHLAEITNETLRSLAMGGDRSRGGLQSLSAWLGSRSSNLAPERKELARRFREKYSSGKRLANVVPYFVGVFDTVAALGSSGLRRLMAVIESIPDLMVVDSLAVMDKMGP